MNKSPISIPDFRKNSSILSLVVVTEILALFISLVGQMNVSIESFGLTSLYLLIITLIGAMGVALIKRKLINRSYTIVIVSLFIAFFVPFVLVEIASQLLFMQVHLVPFDWYRMLNHTLVFLIVIIIAIRLFSLMSIFKRRSQMEVEQRFQALQSRIQPHFLFNSLNTISELAATDAAQAESAIQDLSLLFRASLETVNKPHTLQAEIDLCDRYLALEKWRLGDKLSVSKNIAIDKANKWYVPKLILQPLLENAVKYGADERGQVSINMDLKETDKFLSVMIENGCLEQMGSVQGNGMAIENIKQRLFVLYDDQQSFKVRKDQNRYQVIIRLPKQARSIIFND